MQGGRAHLVERLALMLEHHERNDVAGRLQVAASVDGVPHVIELRRLARLVGIEVGFEAAVAQVG